MNAGGGEIRTDTPPGGSSDARFSTAMEAQQDTTLNRANDVGTGDHSRSAVGADDMDIVSRDGSGGNGRGLDTDVILAAHRGDARSIVRKDHATPPGAGVDARRGYGPVKSVLAPLLRPKVNTSARGQLGTTGRDTSLDAMYAREDGVCVTHPREHALPYFGRRSGATEHLNSQVPGR